MKGREGEKGRRKGRDGKEIEGEKIGEDDTPYLLSQFMALFIT